MRILGRIVGVRSTEQSAGVTIQYLHSYKQKSIPNRLRRWDFCLPAYVFLRSAQQVRRPTEQLPAGIKIGVFDPDIILIWTTTNIKPQRKKYAVNGSQQTEQYYQQRLIRYSKSFVPSGPLTGFFSSPRIRSGWN